MPDGCRCFTTHTPAAACAHHTHTCRCMRQVGRRRIGHASRGRGAALLVHFYTLVLKIGSFVLCSARGVNTSRKMPPPPLRLHRRRRRRRLLFACTAAAAAAATATSPRGFAATPPRFFKRSSRQPSQKAMLSIFRNRFAILPHTPTN
jgi:hypothetical protein